MTKSEPVDTQKVIDNLFEALKERGINTDQICYNDCAQQDNNTYDFWFSRQNPHWLYVFRDVRLLDGEVLSIDSLEIF